MQDEQYREAEARPDEGVGERTSFEPETGAPKSGGGYGPIIGTIIIVILLIVGGLYLWGRQLVQNESDRAAETMIDDGYVYEIADEGAFDGGGAADIEADLDAFDITTLEADLDAELGALEEAL